MAIRLRLFELLFVSVVLTTLPAFGLGAGKDKQNKHMDEVHKRAERGFVREQLELANAYLEGRGVPQDLQKAAHWYEEAAKRGDPQAENQIGFFYQKGIGVRVDETRAVHWY